jgi:hypothetical protein
MHFLKSAQNCASFDTLCGQFREKKIQLLLGAVVLFLGDKRSNQVVTIQHFKNAFFETRILMVPKSLEAK